MSPATSADQAFCPNRIVKLMRRFLYLCACAWVCVHATREVTAWLKVGNTPHTPTGAQQPTTTHHNTPHTPQNNSPRSEVESVRLMHQGTVKHHNAVLSMWDAQDLVLSHVGDKLVQEETAEGRVDLVVPLFL